MMSSALEGMIRADLVIITETRDGKKYNDPESTEEMRVKNRAFSRAHAMSIHLNLVAIGATIWYGFLLASRMEVVIK